MHDGVMPSDHLGPGLSVLFVYGIMLALPIAVVVVQVAIALWHRRSGKRGHAAGETVLKGQVALAEGADVAVKITIRQRGAERKTKSGWSHTWTETQREVIAEPFYLVEPSGRRIRIEPDDRVLLVDAVDVSRPIDGETRLRVAELTGGEAIFASGALVDAHDPQAPADYRGTAKTLVLRPPTRGRMLLSTEPLGERFHKRASLHMSFGLFLAAVTLLFQLFAFPYHARLFAGVEDTGTLVSKRHYVTRSNNNKTDHWELTIVTADGVRFTDDVESEHYRRIDVNDAVPVLRVPSWEGLERVGKHPSIAVDLPTGFVTLFVIIVFVYVGAVRLTRPWYERPLSEGGAGKLSHLAPS